jgi:hypothetical protein
MYEKDVFPIRQLSIKMAAEEHEQRFMSGCVAGAEV